MFVCDVGVSEVQEKLEGSNCKTMLYAQLADELKGLSSQEDQTKL